MRWEFTDNNGQLITDYSFGNVTIGINIMSRPEFAQIYGSVTDFEFSTCKVNNQGWLYMDQREVELDTS